MPDRLDDLGEHLLRAGLSPARVDRYVRELREHRQDIAEHLVDEGRDRAAAMSEADRRLGGFDALLVPMLADRRFRSAAARWPALFFVVLPLASQVLFAAASLLLLVGLAATPLRPGTALLWLAIPVVIAWLTILSALRRRTAPLWPILGCLALPAFATALQLQVDLPSPSAPGHIGLTLAAPALLPLAVLACLSLLPFLLRKAQV